MKFNRSRVIILLASLLTGSIVSGVYSADEGSNTDPWVLEFSHSICTEHEGCKVLGSVPAGTDSKGDSMFLFEMESPPQTWLVHIHGQAVIKKQKIGDKLYFDASGDTLDSRIKDGTVTLPTHCGNFAWMGCNYAVLQFDPLKIISTEEGGAMGRHSWRWDTFSGSGRTKSRGDDEESKTFNYLVIPDVQGMAPLWDKVPLGNCALDLNSKNGFLIAGHLQPTEESVLKALLDGKTLIVNVYGNTWTHGASNWLYDDHLEIWSSPDQEADGQSAAYQWGIRLADGKVFPAFGKPHQNLDVRLKDLVDSKDRKIRSIAITFPDGNIEGMSLSYSAGAGERKVNWLLSSSQIKHGRADSLGKVKKIDPALASCESFNGYLNVKLMTPQYNPDEPIFSSAN